MLGIRGDAPVLQPLVSAVTGDVLAWNGEVFGGLKLARGEASGRADGPAGAALCCADGGSEADTPALLRALERARSVGEVLGRVQGPWSAVVWVAAERALYFGRDPTGRRSLLVARTSSGLALCSVAVPLAELCAQGEGTDGCGCVRGAAGSSGGCVRCSAAALAADWQELPPLPTGALWRLSLEREGEAACAASGAGRTRDDAGRAGEEGEANTATAPPAEAVAGEAAPGHGCACAAAGGNELGPSCAARGPEGRFVVRVVFAADAPPSVQPLAAAAAAAQAGEGEGAEEEEEGVAFAPAVRQQQRLVCSPPASVCNGLISSEEAATALFSAALSEAVRLRVSLIGSSGSGGGSCGGGGSARVAVLFSGGIDSMVLAALAHAHLPAGMPIELINVAFVAEPAQPAPAGSAAAAGAGCAAPAAIAMLAPDRLSALHGLQELRQAAAQREWRLVLVDVTVGALAARRAAIESLIAPAATVMDFNIGAALWFGARGEGRLHQPPHGHELSALQLHHHQQEQQEEEAPGGAAPPRKRRAAPCPPPLTGAAGTSARALCRYASAPASTGGAHLPVHGRPQGTGSTCAAAGGLAGGAAPGSLGAAGGAVQLLVRCRLVPLAGGRSVRLAIGALGGGESTAQPRAHSPAGAAPAAAPREPGCAADGQPYRCAARVLLVGTGADEQLAGYGRHRTAYRLRGQAGLEAELQQDIGRLWLRNLGRDDRAMADSGREARHPFLDERLMAAVRACGPCTLYDLSLPLGVGDKRALRALGRTLGLGASTRLQKRAIQFGTRLANKKVAGDALLSDAIATADLVHRGDGVAQPQLGAGVRKPRGGKPRPPALAAAATS